MPSDWGFVKIAPGWEGTGRVGVSLGQSIFVRENPRSGGQFWTPVLWDDEEDPTFHKTSGLLYAIPPRNIQRRLTKRTEERL